MLLSLIFNVDTVWNQINRVRLEETDPSDRGIRTQSEGLGSFAAALEKYPLMFSIQDGEVEHLCPSEDEELWILNVKRGIISAMQNSMQNMQVPQKIYEVYTFQLYEFK